MTAPTSRPHRDVVDTIQANDARDLVRAGRVTVVPVEETRGADGLCPIYRVELDGDPIGVVVYRDGRWVAARPGWRDTQPRSKRHAAVRRVVMSHPRTILRPERSHTKGHER